MRSRHRKKKVVKTNQTPDWLKSIQLNSWEAELLVSALLLYVLFQVPETLDLYFRRTIESGSILLMLANIMIKGIKLIRLGYSLHILIRGIWVATIGLSYVFPEGLSREKLRFKERFDKELENSERLDGFVLTLEKLASTIYGISFMLFGIYLGAFSLFFILVFVGEYGVARAFQQDNTWLALLSTAFILVYIGAILILFVDFISNGVLRRDRSTARWFYYVAVTFRVITFSILYRRSMLVILSNLPLWWRRLLPFMFIVVVFSYWLAGELKTGYDLERYYDKPEGYILPENYESQRTYGDVTRVTIPEFTIYGEVIEVFMRDIGNLGRVYKAQPGIDFRVRWDDLPPVEKSEFLQKLVLIDVDKSYFLETDWLEAKNKYDYMPGFYGYVNVSDVPDGLHNLNLRLNKTLLDSIWTNTSNPDMQMQLSNIPFYLDKP